LVLHSHQMKTQLIYKGIFVFILLLLSQTIFASTLFPIEKKGKWGYMDETGKMIIDFKFDIAGEFNEGYATVALNRMPCVIDENENRIIDTGLYQFIGNYSEGLVSVMDYKFKRYYLNNESKIVIKLAEEIYDAGTFHNGLARVGKKIDIHQNKFGVDISNLGYAFTYIKKDGTYLTDFIFDDADDFIEPVARVLQGKKFGLINLSGKFLIEPRYSNMSVFNEGLAVVDYIGSYGYIDTNGVEIIKPQFEYAKAFSNGMAAVSVKGKFGFIDTDGKLAIPAKFDDVRPFAEGRAAVLEMNKWAFVDDKGNYIYQPYFEEASYFNEGLCPVKLKGKWGAIDKQGHILVPFQFEFVGIFENGVAEVVYRGINLYVDLRGNVLPRLN
jgi:hypothetical protein